MKNIKVSKCSIHRIDDYSLRNKFIMVGEVDDTPSLLISESLLYIGSDGRSFITIVNGTERSTKVFIRHTEYKHNYLYQTFEVELLK